MTGVLIKGQNLDTHKHTERMKAETTSQGIPKTARKPAEGMKEAWNQPAWTLDS